MVQAAGFSNSYASGEISPDAWERSDLQQFGSGCDTALNFIGRVTGPNASRGGALFGGTPKYQDRARVLLPWKRADGEGLIIELGDLYGRIWTARGALLRTGGGAPVEFTHGYSAADLAGLRLRQLGDLGFLTHRANLFNLVIKRLSDTNWTCGAYSLKDGPWLPLNVDDAKTLTMAEISSGIWSMEFNFDILTPAHVGSIWWIGAPNGQPGLQSWAPNTLFNAGQAIVSGGRIYNNASGAIKSGNTPPTHDQGTVSDGAINWVFQQDGAGVVTIQTVTDARNAVALVPRNIPLIAGGAATATTRWREGAFSNARGWPGALAAVREERLIFGATAAEPDVLHLSRTAGFNPTVADFKPGLGSGLVVDDDALRVQVGGERARIIWAHDAINLVVGTTEAEWIVSGSNIDDPIIPADAKPRRISGHGSADVMPVVIEGPPAMIIHVARAATALRELQLAGGVIAPGGRDLSVLSQHIFGRGVKQMAWSKPDNNIWLLLNDGGLASLTYHYEEQVIGARRHQLPNGFLAESIATTPDPDGRDRLHIAAVRTKGGVAQRLHLYLADRDKDQVFCDVASLYVGAPTLTVANLDHLEGETVTVLADGGLLTDRLVTGGVVALDQAASEVIVGLRMLRRFRSLPFDPNRDGTPIAKKARPVTAYVVFGGVTVKVYSEPQDEPSGQDPLFEVINTRRPGDTIPRARRKRARVPLGGGADRDNRVVLETDDPFDLVIYANRYVEDVP